MPVVTYEQVEALVRQLPVTKLPIAYELLEDLSHKQENVLTPQKEFLRLSLRKRRQLLKQQAEEMKLHYEQTASERTEWQTGEFIDYETRGNLASQS
ncbi:MAG: hypothetical protein U0350_08805 [Caldilineaceae bacterium]